MLRPFKDKDAVELLKIIGRAIKENTASIRVLERAGIQFEKEFEAHGTKCVPYHVTP